MVCLSLIRRIRHAVRQIEVLTNFVSFEGFEQTKDYGPGCAFAVVMRFFFFVGHLLLRLRVTSIVVKALGKACNKRNLQIVHCLLRLYAMCTLVALHQQTKHFNLV